LPGIREDGELIATELAVSEYVGGKVSSVHVGKM
jgi:hypothetical protein